MGKSRSSSALANTLLAVCQRESSPALVLEFVDIKDEQLKDCIQGQPNQYISDLCTALQNQAKYMAAALQDGDGDDEPLQPPQDELPGDLAEKGLQHVAKLAEHMFSLDMQQPCTALQELAFCLHDESLLAIGSCPAVQDKVSALCCKWWQAQAPGRECLVAQTIPYILVRAVTSSKAADVKTCFAMRTAMELLDFEDPSIVDVKRLMLRAAFSEAFYSRPDGCKFLSFLFTLDPQLTRDLTTIIRNQIAGGKKSMLQAYGSIIFRAWRDAKGPCLHELETTTIQGLMNAALLAQTQTLASCLRTVLNGLHSQKRMAGVDSMLLRLYEPILFRALSAANPAVRRNALQLLFDVFPLHDPAAPADEADALLTKQFSILADALTDSSPDVRITAITGVCAVLDAYWELIPSATAAGYVSRLVNELAFDVSTPGVRIAVLDGMAQLLNNQYATEVLKKVLPKLACQLGDKSVKVREKMAHLLQMIASSSHFSISDIIQTEVLVDVMSADDPHVSLPVQQVLLPTFFPTAEEGPARVAALLKTNPKAGQAFCHHLVAHLIDGTPAGKPGLPSVTLTPEQLVQVAKALSTHAITCPPNSPLHPASKRQRKSKKQASGRAATGKRKAKTAAEPEAASSQAEVLPSEKCAVEEWESILCGLQTVCAGVAAAIEQEICDPGIADELFEVDALTQLLDVCPDSSCRRAVLGVAATLPDTPAAAEVRKYCFHQLVKGSGQGVQNLQAVQEDLLPMLACVCSSNGGAKLICVLQRALDINTPQSAASAPGRTPAVCRVSDPSSCRVCGEPEPEDTLLLCDGCDAPYHTTCLRPRLTAVPEGHWFCGPCESDIRANSITTQAAVRLLSALLEDPNCRSTVIDSSILPTLQPLLDTLAARHSSALLQDLTNPVNLSVRSTAQGSATAGGSAHCIDGLLLVTAKSALHSQLAAVLSAAQGKEGQEKRGAEAQDDDQQGEPAELAEVEQILERVAGWCEQLVQGLQGFLDSCTQTSDVEVFAKSMARPLRDLSDLLGLLSDMMQLRLLPVVPATSTSAPQYHPLLTKVLAVARSTAALIQPALSLAASEGQEQGEEEGRPVQKCWPPELQKSLLLVTRQLVLGILPTTAASAQHVPSPPADATVGQEDVDPVKQCHELAASASRLCCQPSVDIAALRPVIPSLLSAFLSRSNAWLAPVLHCVGRITLESHQTISTTKQRSPCSSQQEDDNGNNENLAPGNTPAMAHPASTLGKTPLGAVTDGVKVPASVLGGGYQLRTPHTGVGGAKNAGGAESAAGVQLPPFVRALVHSAKLCKGELRLLEGCTTVMADAFHSTTQQAVAAEQRHQQLLAVLGAATLCAAASPADLNTRHGVGARILNHFLAAHQALQMADPETKTDGLYQATIQLLDNFLAV